MPKDSKPSVPHGATIEEAFSAAIAEEFEIFTADTRTRKAVRASISGQVKRRTLMWLAFLQGIRTGTKASGLMHAGQLAVALGLDPETPWPKLLAHVRDEVSS